MPNPNPCPTCGLEHGLHMPDCHYKCNKRIVELQNALVEALTYFPDSIGRYKWLWDECTSEEQEFVAAARGKLSAILEGA